MLDSERDCESRMPVTEKDIRKSKGEREQVRKGGGHFTYSSGLAKRLLLRKISFKMSK